MSRYYYDTEFHENGYTIDLISIGIVAEDGREYYAINRDAYWPAIAKNDWLVENVLAHLPGEIATPPDYGLTFLPDDTDPRVKSRRLIAQDVRSFVIEEDREDVQLWADFGSYDHVVRCQLFGKMIDLPPNMPMFSWEFQQFWRSAGKPELPAPPENAHDALEDARHLKACWEATQRSLREIE